MTIDQFNNTRWHAGMKAIHHSRPLESFPIVTVDFEEALIGIAGFVGGAEPGEVHWVRCENVTIANAKADTSP